MPKTLATNGLNLLQDGAYKFLKSLKTSPPIANGEDIGKAMGIHNLSQPQKTTANNAGWVTGAVLELAIQAGRVKIVSTPSGKTGRYYEAI